MNKKDKASGILSFNLLLVFLTSIIAVACKYSASSKFMNSYFNIALVSAIVLMFVSFIFSGFYRVEFKSFISWFGVRLKIGVYKKSYKILILIAFIFALVIEKNGTFGVNLGLYTIYSYLETYFDFSRNTINFASLFTIILWCEIVAVLNSFFCFQTERKYQEMVDGRITLSSCKSADLIRKLNSECNGNSSNYELIQDVPSSDDVFGYGDITERIKNTIKSHKDPRGLVIGVEGPCGCGKSSIVSMLKKELSGEQDIKVLDTFDASAFSDEMSLIRALLSHMFYGTCYRVIQKNVRSHVKNISGLIISEFTGGKVSNISKETELTDYKDDFNRYLVHRKIKYVVVIDEIDRCEEENVLMLFKLLGGFLRLDNVIYVLAYDDKRVRNIYDNRNAIGSEYLNKVVQMQFIVPRVKREAIYEVFNTFMKTINPSFFKKVSPNIKDLALDMLMGNSQDYKNLINFLNLMIVQKNDFVYDYVNADDLLLLNVIKFKNRELFDFIRQNKKLLVAEPDEFIDIRKTRYGINEKSISKIYEVKFNELLKKGFDVSYIRAMQHMFPSFDYFIKRDASKYSSSTAVFMIDKLQNNRMYRANYFDDCIYTESPYVMTPSPLMLHYGKPQSSSKNGQCK